MLLKILKILLLVSYCLFVYQNGLVGRHAFYLYQLLVDEWPQFRVEFITGVLAILMLLLNMLNVRWFKSISVFFTSVVLMAYSLFPYNGHYRSLMGLTPSAISIALFVVLLVTVIMLQVKQVRSSGLGYKDMKLSIKNS